MSYISVMEGDVIKIRSKYSVFMNLIFSEEELVAIAKLANAMIVADGKVAEREMDSWIMEMERFGVSKSDFHLWYWKSEGLSLTDALGVVSKLDDERKKYIGAFLGALMAVDGHVDGDELKFICAMYDFNGNFVSNYVLNDPLFVNGEIHIGDIDISDYEVLATYQFTDLYQQNYWTTPIKN